MSSALAPNSANGVTELLDKGWLENFGALKHNSPKSDNPITDSTKSYNPKTTVLVAILQKIINQKLIVQNVIGL